MVDAAVDNVMDEKVFFLLDLFSDVHDIDLCRPIQNKKALAVVQYRLMTSSWIH